MVNMNVGYVRSCYSLIQLQAEIRRTFGSREQNKGFVTGYMDGARAGGLSGHYADHRGVTYAYDIGVDIEGDGSGLLPRDAEWLFDYLETQQNARFQYAIYNNRITGNHTGWDMDPYIGASPHKDHIHISVVDLQWGEPSGVSPAITDSRASWGVYEAYHGKGEPAQGPALKPAADNKQKLEWSDMATKNEIREVVRDEIRRIVGDVVDVPTNYGSKESRDNNPTWTVSNALTKIWNRVEETNNKIDDVPRKVLQYPVKLRGDFEGTTDIETKVAWLAHEQHRGTDATLAVYEKVSALAKAVTGQVEPETPEA